MRRTALLLSFLACALTSFAESRVWVSPLEIKPGEKSYLRVNYEFDKEHIICNYQMKVILPDGVTVDGTSVVLGSCHTAHSGSIVNNELVVTSMNVVLQGTSGVLVEIPVIANNNLTIGTKLEGSLEEVKLGQTSGTSINSTGITFDVNIVDYILLDENSITAPVSTSGATKKVKVKRTIKAGEWSTICLPFDMDEEQLSTAFGNDAKMAYFTSYTPMKDGENVTGLNIAFNDNPLSYTLYANYPYMIKTTKDISEFELTTTINPQSVQAKYETGSGPSLMVLGSFIGTYQAETIVPENSLFLNGNKFYYSAGKTKMKAFRAYFTLQDVLTEVSAAGARIMMSFDDETTDVKHVTFNIKQNTGEWYTLDGRKLDKKPTAKGVYVKDGRKIVIK